MAFNLCGFAQLKSYDLANSDNLRFIPSYMTKDGKCFLYSCGNGYIVYDDNFNIIKQYNSSNIINYQSREVKYSRLIDPDTKEFLSEWE